MSKKNLLSGRDKELQEMADRYEAAQAEGRAIYMDADDLADLADWYAMHHKLDTANAVVGYGLGIHPQNTSLMVEQANLSLEMGDIAEARKTADLIDEETSEVKVLKADILYGEGKPQEAEALLESIEDKDDLYNIIDVAYMYLDNGFPRKALNQMKQGEKYYRDEEAYMAALADCYYSLGQTERAIEYFDRLIDRNPYSASFWYGLAQCHFDRQQYGKAIDACDYANLIDEEFGDAYMLKGHAYALLDNTEKAMENFGKVQKLLPYAETWHDIGLYWMETGEIHHAKYAFEQVHTMNPDFDGINEKLTILSLLLNDRKDFEKYNKLCKHPFSAAELKSLLRELEHADLQTIIDNIFDILNTK